MRLKRIIKLTLILYAAATLISTINSPLFEETLIKFGYEPSWDIELMNLRRWNRLVKNYGVEVGAWKFENTQEQRSNP